MNCIFCEEILDNSDEHIIPESLNGRLHSKNIICYNCNSNIFGKNVDPLGKEFFNPLMLAYNFKNARGTYFYNPEGDKFLQEKDGSLKSVVPKVSKKKIGTITALEVTGDPINAYKLFVKEAKKFDRQGKKNVRIEVKQLLPDGVPLKSDSVYKLHNGLKLLLNKVAFEYLAINGLNLEKYRVALKRVKDLDDTIENVYLCNLNEEIRQFGAKELTHLIKPVLIKNKLIVYIELFNIICAIVKIDDNYEHKITIEQYYQDSINGSRLTNEVQISENKVLEIIDLDPKDFVKKDLGNLIQRAFEVQRRIKHDERLKEETEKPILELKQRFEKGEIDKRTYDHEVQRLIIEKIALLSVEEFPYMFDDIPDEMDNNLHYLHSNLREEQYEEFCEKNGHLIGKGIIDGVNKKFFITGFENYPVIVKNGVSIIKIFVVIEGESGKIRLPYKEVFEMEPINLNK